MPDMPASGWSLRDFDGNVASTPAESCPSMTAVIQPAARPRIAPLGLVCLLVTALSWGLAWPISKYLLAQLPPMSMRGGAGFVGGLLLIAIARARGYSLAVPRDQWSALILSSFLNVTIWVALIGLALLWLPASEAAVITATMPVWTTALAWLLINERLTTFRVLGLAMGVAGIVALTGSHGLTASLERAPGLALALTASFGFALGVVLMKRKPLAIALPVAAGWQVLLGCLPVVVLGIVIERPNLAALNSTGAILLLVMASMQFCLAYLCWFTAIKMLPASIASIGTLAVPVIGVVASAVALGEPLGPGQIAALVFTLAGVVLATRS
jgi:drug/metabolite transporter (DMT)-like permease